MGCFLRPSTPSARTVSSEGLQTLQGQAAAAPQTLQLESQYRPSYVGLGLGDVSQYMTGSRNADQGLLGLYQQSVLPTATQATSSSRAAAAQDLTNLAPAAASAARAANPNQYALLDQLTKSASDQLALGSSVDPSTAREVAQGVRAAQASRGMGFGPADVTAEAFARGTRGEALRQSRQGFANQVASLNGQAAVDPFRILNSGGDAGLALALLGNSQQAAAGSQPTLFDPFSQYAQDIYNTNYNATAAANLAAANNMAGVVGGITSSL